MDISNMSDEDRYILARWCYSIGEDFISDAEYNNLHRMMQSIGRLEEYTSRSWSSDPCPYELLKKYALERLAVNVILSDSTESIEALTSESEIESVYGNLDSLVLVSYKHDGWNGQLTYHNKYLIHKQTRGRLHDYMDISSVSDPFPTTIDRDGKVRIIGEMNLTDAAFRKLKQMYPEKDLQSQRASVSTAIANKEAHHLLSFTAFDILLDDGKELPATYIYYLLTKWGFTVPNYKVAKNYEELIDAIKSLSDAKDYYGHLTDGLVVRSDIGKFMRAIRVLGWEEPIYKSFVMGYEEEPAAHTRTFSIKIYPIKLQNSTQRYIPITNLRRIVENDLRPGAPIAFKFTSASIADIDITTTSVLQSMYEGRYASFQKMIEQEEYVKSFSAMY